jgi:hypothetical protein
LQRASPTEDRISQRRNLRMDPPQVAHHPRINVAGRASMIYAVLQLCKTPVGSFSIRQTHRLSIRQLSCGAFIAT